MAIEEADDFEDFARTPTGAAVLALVGVVVLVGGRVLLAGVLGDTVHPITYAGFFAGLLGSAAMVLVWWDLEVLNVCPPAQVWRGVLDDPWGGGGTVVWLPLHVVYATLLGGLYPRLAHTIFQGTWWPTLPMGIVVGLAFANVLFALAVGYKKLGLFVWTDDYSIGTMAATHLVYGLVLGFVVGLFGFL